MADKTPSQPKTKPARKLKNNGQPHPTTTGKPVPNVDQTNWRKKIQQSRIKFDDDQKKIYCDQLAEHGMKGRARQAAGVCGQTVTDHLKNDPEFVQHVDDAIDAYRDDFVGHAIGDLARKGIEVVKYNKEGDVIETRRDYPVRLIELELKRVETGYRDKQTIDMNHTGGVMIAPADTTPEEWMAQQAAANDKKEEGGEG